MEQRVMDGIVRASGVTAGEVVLVHFWGETEELPIAHGFMQAVAAQGASPVLLHQARSVNQRIFAAAGEGSFGEGYFRLLDAVDAVLDVFAYRPVVLGAALEEKQQERYRQYMRKLFGRLMKCRRFAQIRIPTIANAEESGLEAEAYVRRMNAAYGVDYELLAQRCRSRKASLPAGRCTLHTGSDCVLHLDLTGRSWHIDAGDGDWPCGEVYIAPLESASRGSVWFPEMYIEDAGHFGAVTLTVEDGRVIGCDHAQVQAWLDSLPGEGRIVAELGLGMNPGVKDLCGYTVLDEKMDGSFHLALGANSMFGGINHASMHVDLVGQGKWTLKEENDHA